MSNKNNKYKNGLYVDCKYDKIAIDELMRQFKEAGFKLTTKTEDVHSTIIFSRQAPSKEFSLKEKTIKVFPKKLTVFPKGDSGFPLVLELESNDLKELHNEYMRKYRLSYDYDEYIPHITITYDLEESLGIKIEDSETIEKVLNSLEISYPKSITSTGQSESELDEDWEANHKED